MVEQRANEANLNKATPQEKRQWFTEHLTKQSAPLATTIQQTVEIIHVRYAGHARPQNRISGPSCATAAKSRPQTNTSPQQHTNRKLNFVLQFLGCVTAALRANLVLLVDALSLCAHNHIITTNT